MLNGDSCILMFPGVIYSSVHSFQGKLVYQEKGWILGQNVGAKTPTRKTLIQKMFPSNTLRNPKLKSQWHFSHWRIVRGIQIGYQSNFLILRAACGC